ncbi:hypothetical protein [Listeria monocytogenes]|uniref:hypothetical protein n=1 Tax=Listeria monocytogenes TaxID=1639 RepID=UPI00215A19C0|nr:hypothetical protein [Listeria monocytogenes]
MAFKKISMSSEMKRLGFLVGIDYLVYTKELSRSTMLVVEGSKVKGHAEYMYTFYKVFYEGKQQYAKYLKVYITNQSAVNIIKKVENYLKFVQINYNQKRN